MGGRGTFAAGISVDYTYVVDTSYCPDGKLEGVKILKGADGSGKHGLPESSHSSNAYIKLKPDGTFHEMRLYNDQHVLYMEIAYHPEPKLTGNRETPILHYHLYDDRFSKNKTGPFERTEPKHLTGEIKTKYGKFFKGVKYD